MTDRPIGTVVYDSTLTPNLIAKAATAHQKQLEAERRAAAEKRAARPVPNRVCYATTAFKNWKPGMRLPKCRRCDAILHPEENHVCPGFQPKYVEHDAEWHERKDAQHEEIRKAKHQRETPTCKLCGAELPTEDDYWAHGSECSGL